MSRYKYHCADCKFKTNDRHAYAGHRSRGHLAVERAVAKKIRQRRRVNAGGSLVRGIRALVRKNERLETEVRGLRRASTPARWSKRMLTRLAETIRKELSG